MVTKEQRDGVVFDGGGVSGEVVRALDWAETPLGSMSAWSTGLKATVRLLLCSRHPMLLIWGRELIVLYNDAFRSRIQDGMVVEGIGRRGPECWPEVWPTVDPEVRDAIERGRSSWYEDRLVPVPRRGRIEEAYWTYSASPVFDESGTVGGALFVCMETTRHVLAERRAATLRTLVTRLAQATERSELSRIAMDVLRRARWDFPFAAHYEIGADGVPSRRRATLDESRDLLSVDAAVRAHVSATGGVFTPPTATVDHAPLRPLDGPWPEPVTSSFVATVPKTDATRSTTALVVGVSPRLPADAAYRDHVEQVVQTVIAAEARLDVRDAETRTETERRHLLRQTPVATVLSTGLEQRIVVANEAFRDIIGRDVVGKTFAEAFPWLVGTDVEERLQHVYRTGEPYATVEQCLTVEHHGVVEDRWFKFNVQPVRDHAGEVFGMMAVALDVTDEVLARRALEACCDERGELLSGVETANRAKDEFLAMLGHELRNPLAPITTALHLMRLKEPDVLVREREIIARQAAHLVQLVDDLLDVSRIARGKVTLNRARVPIADALARAVETATPLLEQKRHHLSFDVPAVGLDVEGDVLRLGQVFSNLLTNAAKYTESGGRISATARREDDEVVVRVADNGVGIAPDQIPRLFDAFFQVARPHRAQGGLGLGLTLVKSFVTLHGGTVSACCREGGGSVFEVRLPALAGAPAAEATPNGDGSAAPRPSAARQRVLLVDDSDDILEIVASFLRFEGYDVLEARDAPSALRAAPGFRPNVAVLDIGLPAMDGYDLARHLREELGERAPKMIAMTGYGQEADRERALRAGFVAHLVKPVDPKDLLASVRESLR